MRRRVRGVSDVVVPERRVTGSGGTCWDGTGSEGDLDGACEGGRGEPGQAEPGRVPHGKATRDTSLWVTNTRRGPRSIEFRR